MTRPYILTVFVVEHSLSGIYWQKCSKLDLGDDAVGKHT